MKSKLLRTLLMMTSSAVAASAATRLQAHDQAQLGELPTALSESHVKAFATAWSLPPITPLTDQQLAAAPCARVSPGNASPLNCRTTKWILAQPLQHPLTPREVSMRDEVLRLGARRKQFVLCELSDGRKVTGTIGSARVHSFFLNTGLFDRYQEVRYSELRVPPRPVAAVGKKILDGLEIAGMVAVVIVALPIVLPLYPLLLALGAAD